MWSAILHFMKMPLGRPNFSCLIFDHICDCVHKLGTNVYFNL